jgi:ferrous iron transport protein B
MASDRLQGVAETKSAAPLHAPTHLTVALAGQPNVGKSTVFNILTGLTQHVGNWPGKTIEQRTGRHHYQDLDFEIVDLPGTYSLSAASQEEIVARDFILRERPDVVVCVISAAALERNLYLVAELSVLPAPLIVAINMVDVAEREGIRVDAPALAAALGVPVLPMVASRNQGVAELVATVAELARGERRPDCNRPAIRADHAAVCEAVEALVAPFVPERYPSDWVALKLLEGDVEVTERMRPAMGDVWERVHAILRLHEDAGLAVASGRYEWIERVTRGAVVSPRLGEVTLTGRLDRWATHPVWGLGVLGLVLGATYAVTFGVGMPLQRAIEAWLVTPLATHLKSVSWMGPWWLRSFLADGLLAGLGTVLSFLPVLVVFFTALALIEDTGYMARAAYVTDPFMHQMGLHGKSSLPLLLGFGCNVPAVMGARILESRQARLLTILLAPLVPCASRMTIVVFMAPLFFGRLAPLVALALVALALGTLAGLGVLARLLWLRGSRTAFIMEMPLYHRPMARTVALQVGRSCSEFLRKAGTLILLFTCLLWALATFPGGRIETSALYRLGHWLEPVGSLMGLDWRMMVALVTSFFAKENAVAALGVLFGGGAAPVTVTLAKALTPAAALAYLVAQVLFVPCAATVVTIKQEAGGWRWVTLVITALLVISFAAAVATYQIGRAL